MKIDLGMFLRGILSELRTCGLKVYIIISTTRF